MLLSPLNTSTSTKAPVFKGDYSVINKFLAEHKNTINKTIEKTPVSDFKLSEKFLYLPNNQEIHVGDIVVFHKNKLSSPVKLDIQCIKDDNKRTYTLFNKEEKVGDIITRSNEDNKLTEYFKKGHEYISVMCNLIEERYKYVGTALHNIAKLTAMVNGKKDLTLFAYDIDRPPVLFHAKNGFRVLAEANGLSLDRARRLNLLLDSHCNRSVRESVKKLNYLYMSYHLPD